MDLSPEQRELIAKLQPLDVPGLPCTDCVPEVDGLHIRHAPMCPVALCVEDATSADRVWFESHPFADTYNRPVTWGEGAALLVFDDKMLALSKSYALSAEGWVKVDRLSDGVRIRDFRGVWFSVTPRPGSESERLSPAPPS